MHAVVGLHAQAAAAKGIRLAWESEGTLPLRVSGDSTRIGQVLNNLLSNAIKFTASGGVLVKVAHEPHPEDPAYLVRLRFSIADTGPGIPAEKLAHIFTPFSQADASITRKFGGTGLGLTIANDLAELMGGGLAVESELGRGSIFHFRAVLTQVEAQEAQATDEPALAETQGRGACILLVEDTPVNQVLGRAILEKQGFQVVLAEDGQLAVAAARGRAFDAILMDMQMPNMDGLEATRLIREGERASGRAAVPIIAMTANAMESDRIRCMEAGMDAFLAKPFRRQEIMAVLGRFLSSSVH
jgi:CheY-like chemotaxis protein